MITTAASVGNNYLAFSALAKSQGRTPIIRLASVPGFLLDYCSWPRRASGVASVMRTWTYWPASEGWPLKATM
jgi:hypothetical protein